VASSRIALAAVSGGIRQRFAFEKRARLPRRPLCGPKGTVTLGRRDNLARATIVTNKRLSLGPFRAVDSRKPRELSGMLRSPSGSTRGALRETWWRRMQTLANESHAQKVPLETGSHSEWRWQSRANPFSGEADFPANREKNREFPRIRSSGADFRPNSARTFGHLRENSLRTRTGDFSGPNRVRGNREFEPSNRERRPLARRGPPFEGPSGEPKRRDPTENAACEDRSIQSFSEGFLMRKP